MNASEPSSRATFWTARARIVSWMMALVTLALGISVVVTARLLIAREETRVQAELQHEGQELRALAAAPDPATGEGFRSVQSLLDTFLEHNLPEDDETFFSIVNGHASRRSPSVPPARLDQDAVFVADASSFASPAAGRIETAAGGTAYAVFPVLVSGDPADGRLVVVQFSDPGQAQVWSVVRILGGVGSAALVAAGALAWLIAGRVLDPIRALRRTAEQIGESDLGRRIAVSGQDDVAEMAQTFNRMLDRIECAFTTQRQFLDDAGHELRTPITAVRGHIELMAAYSDEQRETVALVLDELDRMHRIVNDLVLLAQAEQPDFVLLEPVDLTSLVVETLAKTRPLGDRRWVIDEVAERTVPGDSQRLTQALMQLVSNAVRHTGPQDTIGLGSRVDGDQVLLWVRDTGCGIPTADHDLVFERFRRASGSRDRHGAGLGLPIVSTIAAAHHGMVRVQSSPGQGATFTIDLTARP